MRGGEGHLKGLLGRVFTIDRSWHTITELNEYTLSIIISIIIKATRLRYTPFAHATAISKITPIH